ncbi:unnamed protein product [Owenia fusiformis]|uniref:Uncharacterized protein n=1 Tax=Owenia fusiformis TaxID=6347 RepID=A0A8J1TTV9_OWEFU|nr:unnamed protein product [Owenia fusiformis]
MKTRDQKKYLPPMVKPETLKQKENNKVHDTTIKSHSLKITSKDVTFNERTVTFDLNPEVIRALDRLEMAKSQRTQLEVLAKLEAIHDRIRRALSSGGLPTNVYMSTKEAQKVIEQQSRPPFFETKAKKNKLEHQRQMMELIANFQECCKQRSSVVDEVYDWLQSSKDLEENVVSGKVLAKRLKEYNDIATEIEDALKVAKGAAGKMNTLGYKMLKAAGEIDSDDEEADRLGLPRPVKQNKPSEKTTVFDESMLLGDTGHFKNACKEVKKTLDDTIKSTKSGTTRLLMRGASKQFKFITSAIEKRNEDYQKQAEQLLTTSLDNDRLNNANERLNGEVVAFEKNANRLENQSEKYKKLLKELKAENYLMEQKMEELFREIEDLKHEPEKHTRQPSNITFSKESLRSVRKKSSGELRECCKVSSKASLSDHPVVMNLKEEIEEYKSQVQRCTEDAIQMKQDLKHEQERMAKLQAHMEMQEMKQAEKKKLLDEQQLNNKFKSLQAENDKLEVQIAHLNTELNCRDEKIEYLEKQLHDGNKESLSPKRKSSSAGVDKEKSKELKRVVTKLCKEHEGELATLNDHIAKEKQRHEASLRKVESSHQETLVSIHKESLHLLRAINRFKESLASILERENMPAGAFEVRQLENLITDEKTSTDTRQMLCNMAGDAVELLVSLESKLSQTLMNNSLEIKDEQLSKSFATKDLQAQMEIVTRVRKENNDLIDKLRNVKEKLANTEQDLKDITKMENKKYNDLNVRYKSLWGQYGAVERQLAQLQMDYTGLIKKKDKAVKSVVQMKKEMARSLDDQRIVVTQMQLEARRRKAENERDFVLSLEDQRKNLHVVEQAFTQNKISHDLYELTVDLIKKAISIPELKLRHLFERYIAFRKFKAEKVKLQTNLKNAELPPQQSAELRSFLHVINRRLHRNNKKWEERLTELKEERCHLFERMCKLFSDVVSETGLLLIQPIKQTDLVDTGSPPLMARSPGYPGDLVLPPVDPMPQALVGTGMPLLGDRGPYWKSPSPLPLSPVGQRKLHEVSRLLDLDVNQARVQAIRRLQKMCKQPLPVAKATAYDYVEHVKPLEESLPTFGFTYRDDPSEY